MVADGDRWSKKTIAETTEKDAELALFVSWVKGGLLPVDSNELARHDPGMKTLHAQRKRLQLREGVLYRRYWENNREAD